VSSSTTSIGWEKVSSLLAKMEHLDQLSSSIGHAAIFTHSDMQAEEGRDEDADPDDLPIHLLPEYSQKWSINPE